MVKFLTTIPENFSALNFCIFHSFSQYFSFTHANVWCFSDKTNQNKYFCLKFGLKISSGFKVTAFESVKCRAEFFGTTHFEFYGKRYNF
jgi:hypothetical protein